MYVEAILGAIILALALSPLVAMVWHRRSRAVGISAVALWMMISTAYVGVAMIFPREVVSERQVTNRPIEVQGAGFSYVSSDTCKACHPHQYATWHASYHRTMTQVATPESVVAPFEDVELSLGGRTFHLERRGDEFWTEVEVPDQVDGDGRPRRIERQIVMTTGSHHEQDYWFATEHGRAVGHFPFVYRIHEQQWIPDYAVFLKPHEGSPMASGAAWNASCIKCHATHGRVRPRESGDMDTHVAEFGIACEACHGPAHQHVRINRDPRRRYSFHLNGEVDSSMVNPIRLTHRRASQVCGQCHGIAVPFFSTKQGADAWNEQGYRYRPGDDLDQTRLLKGHNANMTRPGIREGFQEDPHFLEDRFWSDGMVRISGREYNGLVETPCFLRGELSCLSCHSMHKSLEDPRPLSEWTDDQLSLGMDTNKACLQCHDSFGDHLEQHTHHEIDSAGSHCYNCHMPHTTYGLLKAIRSHTIDSPNVATTLQTGRPNACNLCHLDQTLGWTAEHLEHWYGISIPQLTEEHKSIAASALWALRGDAGQRALTAWSMGWEPARRTSGSEWMVPYLAQLLDDPYPAVRFVAYRSLRRFPELKNLKFDVVGSSQQRVAAAQQAVKLWHQTRRTTVGPNRAAVLYDPGGTLQVALFSRLLEQRNNRRVNLKE